MKIGLSKTLRVTLAIIGGSLLIIPGLFVASFAVPALVLGTISQILGCHFIPGNGEFTISNVGNDLCQKIAVNEVLGWS